MKNAIKRPEPEKNYNEVHVKAESTWLDPAVKTKQQLVDWMLVSLGYPGVTVELDDTQIDYCIQNALEKYTKYAWMGPDKYIMVNTKYYEPGHGLNLADKRILSVKEISTQRDNPMGMGMDMFFSPYAFFGQGGMGASPFFNQANVSPTGSWITYQNAMEWYKLAKRMTGSNPDFQYDKSTRYLQLFPEPRCGNQDHFILLTCQVLPPLEELYGNEYVKRLCTAYAKILLGTVRKKFSTVQLLGGGSIDTTIGEQGQQELDKIIEEIIKDESRGQSWIIA